MDESSFTTMPINKDEPCPFCSRNFFLDCLSNRVRRDPRRVAILGVMNIHVSGLVRCDIQQTHQPLESELQSARNNTYLLRLEEDTQQFGPSFCSRSCFPADTIQKVQCSMRLSLEHQANNYKAQSFSFRAAPSTVWYTQALGGVEDRDSVTKHKKHD